MKLKNILTIFIFTLLLLSCSVFIVNFDQDKSVDFKQYKTFAWLVKPSVKFPSYNNQIIESHIKNLVSIELKKHHLKTDVVNPDIFIDYELIIKDKIIDEKEAVYSHPYNYTYGTNQNTTNPRYYNSLKHPNVIIGYDIKKEKFEDGTLAIILIDAKTGKIIWRGWEEEIVTDIETYEAQIPRGIKKIFKKFPTN